MFKTYQDRLVELERLYNDKQYNSTIMECAKLTEAAIGQFFNLFHSFLKTQEENQKYLEFEKEAGDKFQSFVKKPTIGVGISFYNRLLTLFPGKPGLNQDFRSYLNTINEIRNAHAHASGTPASADEAGQVLDALEKLLKGSNLLTSSIDVMGVPLKFFLVVKSIESKFEKAEAEDDFKKIVNDALKIIPNLLDGLLNRLYHSLSLEQKEKLIALYFASAKGSRSLSEYHKIYSETGMFDLVPKGESLNSSLLEISSNSNTYNRRITRHYVNTIQIVSEYSENPTTRHFLDFANTIKKRYLRNRKLDEKDKFLLKEKAAEIGISNDLAHRIEESVITTIEKELILFQTLTPESESGEQQKESVAPQPVRKKVAIAVFATILAIAIALTVYSLWVPSPYSNFEVAYLEDRLHDAEDLAKGQRDLKNIGAHYYYILATQFNNAIFPESVKLEYQRLLKANPDSPEANFYLGIVYMFGSRYREEGDSAWYLINKAQKAGIGTIEMDFINWQMLSRMEQHQTLLTLVERMSKETHPRALHLSASTMGSVKYDTAAAIALWEKARSIYPHFLRSYTEIAEIAMKRRDFVKAKELLEEAKKINPESETVISLLAQLSKDEGRFDEAKGYYRSAISSFGAENKDLHYQLLQILLQEDSIAVGNKFLESSLIKFPKDRVLLNYFKYQFKQRERWLTEDAKINKEKNLLPWTMDFDKALTQSAQEGKPVLVDFYTTWCGWCKVLDKRIYPDSTVQLALSKYILVKINAEQNTKVANSYEVNKFPTLLVLDEKGKRITELIKYITPNDLTKSLSDGLSAYNKEVEGKKITKEQYTLASNLEDAKLIARTRKVPIMMVVGDARSSWSKRLTEQTIQDAAFKSEFTDIVYLPIDNQESPAYLNQYTINHFPSILFLDGSGREYQRVTGYQPPKVLAVKVAEAKKNLGKDKAAETGIHWYYDLDEAISDALVAKKNIFVAGFDPFCDPCNWMEKETFEEKKIIETLNSNFLSLRLERKADKETVARLGINGFPAQMILNESGTEMFRTSGYKGAEELKSWLEIDERIKILSLLGPEKFRAFSTESATVKSLIQQQNYLSASSIIQAQLASLADYHELYSDLATCLNGLKRYDEAIEAYKQSFQKGSPVVENTLDEILATFISAHRVNELKEWLDQAVPEGARTANTKALLAWIASCGSSIVGDNEAAYALAEDAIKADPKLYKAQLQLGILLYRKGDLTRADKTLALSESLDKQDPVASFYRGLIAKQQGRTADKKKFFQEATSRSSWAAGQVSAERLANIPNYYQYSNAFNLVINGSDYASLLDDDNWFPYYMKSVHQFYVHDLDGALASIEDALRVNPDRVFMKFVKAIVLYHQAKPVEASQVMDDASKSFSDDDFFPISDFAYGLYYIEKKDVDKAKFHLARSQGYRGEVAWWEPMQKLSGNKLNEISSPEGK